jgi:hypothetical protein
MRTTMEALVEELRALTLAGVDDVTIAGTTYWTDDQLLAELDKTQVYALAVPLRPIMRADGATYDYLIPMDGPIDGPIERGAAFTLRDAAGAVVSPALYTVSFSARSVTFAADTRGAPCFADLRAYDAYRAASVVWAKKAGFAAIRVDWRADNHTVRGAQEHAHCTMMAAHYARLAGARASRLARTDESPAHP